MATSNGQTLRAGLFEFNDNREPVPFNHGVDGGDAHSEIWRGGGLQLDVFKE